MKTLMQVPPALLARQGLSLDNCSLEKQTSEPPGGERGGLHEWLYNLPHLPCKVRPAHLPLLGAPEPNVRELVGLHERPVPRGWVEDGVQLFPPHRVLHYLANVLRWPPRQESQNDDAERVNVAPWRELAVAVGLGQELAEAEVPQLADEVGVEEDVGQRKVAVHHRMRLVRMEEDQGRAHLADDLGARLPCQPVLEAAVGEKLVHQSECLLARADQCDEVWMPQSAEDSNLQWRHCQSRHECLHDPVN
jgi:hypothetical protein